MTHSPDDSGVLAMMRKFLQSKIHRATVTHCELDYVGSITIDANLLRATGMRPSECVLIANINNGNRFETYIFEGEAGSGVVGLNGAAARLAQVGDQLIICSFAMLDEAEIDEHQPRVVICDEHNGIQRQLTYSTTLSEPAGIGL